MYGDNPKRKALKGDGNILEIQEIFPTLQGEGPRVGQPAVFIRLGGCNLACEFCDTEFETFKEMQLVDVLSEVTALAKTGNIRLVVITGGEPFRQPIEKLCYMLLEMDMNVQMETNGTLFRPIDERVEVVCSPKNTDGHYKKIRPDLLERISAFKFIISAHNKNYSKVEEIGQSKYNVPVYVQPMDENDKNKNRKNLDYTLNLALSNGYSFSLQLHKLLKLK